MLLGPWMMDARTLQHMASSSSGWTARARRSITHCSRIVPVHIDVCTSMTFDKSRRSLITFTKKLEKLERRQHVRISIAASPAYKAHIAASRIRSVSALVTTAFDPAQPTTIAPTVPRCFT